MVPGLFKGTGSAPRSYSVQFLHIPERGARQMGAFGMACVGALQRPCVPRDSRPRRWHAVGELGVGAHAVGEHAGHAAVGDEVGSRSPCHRRARRWARRRSPGRRRARWPRCRSPPGRWPPGGPPGRASPGGWRRRAEHLGAGIPVAAFTTSKGLDVRAVQRVALLVQEELFTASALNPPGRQATRPVDDAHDVRAPTGQVMARADATLPQPER